MFLHILSLVWRLFKAHRTLVINYLVELLLPKQFLELNLLVRIFNFTLFVGLGDFDELYFSPELVDDAALFVEYLLDLDDALFESDLHDDKLILGRVLEELEHLLHLFRVGLLVPEDGLLDDVTRRLLQKMVGLLLRQALDKIAFLPFGLLVDQWRWRVFSGEIAPEEYNSAWWELRREYQGIQPPVIRSEDDFDPGAKYHVPANVPYTRYFLAYILQFQFHRALCAAAGIDGPLHRCSVYGSAEAGARLAAMLEMGASEPWPEALEVIAGTRDMDASAMLDYFAPLSAWLDEQNEGRACGW